jgi:ubiquinone/menaquinone biosynthesis C-methylase UbiE
VKKQTEEHYWSRFAESYDRKGEYVVGKRIIRLIEEALLSERALGDAIEFGCGTGTFTKVIARNTGHLVASDLSNEMLKAARIRLRGFKNVTIQRTDCNDTSFPAESFDSVFLINLIHVIDNPLQCVHESHRILRNRGTLIVVDFTGYRLACAKKMKLGLRYLRTWGIPPRGGRNNMTPGELVSLVEPVGFQVKFVTLLEDGANALYLKGTK